jgi:hypothetical protein
MVLRTCGMAPRTCGMVLRTCGMVLRTCGMALPCHTRIPGSARYNRRASNLHALRFAPGSCPIYPTHLF